MCGRVAVIGAQGYVGRTLLPLLRQAGHRVTGLGRTAPDSAAPDLRFLLCDATDPDALREAIAGIDVVVNVMAGPSAAMMRVAENLAGLLAGGSYQRLVHLSSLAVYGQRRGLATEDTAPVEVRRNGYASAKLAAERHLLGAPGAACTLILRPGCIYGPAAPVWVDRIGHLLVAGRLGDLGWAGDGACNLIHVQDLADMVASAITAHPQAAGIHNLVASSDLTWNDYFSRFALQIGVVVQRRSGLRAAGDAYLRAPGELIIARAGGPASVSLTPSMYRLFSNQLRVQSHRVPLLPVQSLTPLDIGLAQAAAAFGARYLVQRGVPAIMARRGLAACG